MFNQYMWQLYLKAGGKETVSKFENYLLKDYSKSYCHFIKNLHHEYQLSSFILEDEALQLQQLFVLLQQENCIFDNPDISAEDAIDILFSIISENGTLKPQNIFFRFTDSIAYYSTFLAVSFPHFFVPYYFKWNYNVLQIISDTFGFELPELPCKSDYEGRLYFYERICHVLHSFRIKNNLTNAELYAFLYDYAPKYIGGVSSYLISDLPKPKSAFFIGGTKDDVFLANNSETITPWQCNPETKVGDMIVMYLKTPISAIDSIWRSCSIGFIDPFFYYYRCTYICKPIKMQAIMLNDMKKDALMGNLPIVRKNMQGINGVELKPSEYNHIIELGKCNVPRLEYVIPNSETEYVSEREVEELIIKPLLEKLGYHEQDYTQQLYIEIGNHNHILIPDFVLFPQKDNNSITAFAVIEAKRSITTKKQLAAALSQVSSYAKQLEAKHAAIISQEKIWLYSAIDKYSNVVLSIDICSMTDDNIYVLKKHLEK